MADIAENNVNLENLRKGDILTLQSQTENEKGELAHEVVTVRSAVHHPEGVGVVIELAENYALLYYYDGSCPDAPQLSVKSVEFVEMPEDKEVYYTPNHDIIIAPVVTAKGRNKIICQRIVNSVFDLNQFPMLPSGTKLIAEMRHVAIFTLVKLQGRHQEIIKKEMVICDSPEHAKAEIKKMKDRFKEVEEDAEHTSDNGGNPSDTPGEI